MEYITHMEAQKPVVYDYCDVKTYLREYRTFRKSVDDGFTNTYICYVLGQKNSKGYFNNVINGRIRIGPTIIDRFITLLGLDHQEELHFRNLVNYSQARTPEERTVFFKQLMRSSRMQAKELSLELADYYGEWYHSVVRTLLEMIDFDGENYCAIQERMCIPISLPRLKKSITLLSNLDLIVKDEQGFYRPADRTISHNPEMQRELLIQFQEQTLNHGRSALTNSNVTPQKVTTMTIAASKEAIEQIKERITELKEEIRAIAKNDAEQADELYQLSMHLYPHTRKK